MTDFPAKTFPAAWSFPTIRRFRSCVLPAPRGCNPQKVNLATAVFTFHAPSTLSLGFCQMKRADFPGYSLLHRLCRFCQNGRKKSSKSFQIYCSLLPLYGGGYLVFFPSGGLSSRNFKRLSISRWVIYSSASTLICPSILEKCLMYLS